MVCAKCGTSLPGWATVCSGCTREIFDVSGIFEDPDKLVFCFFIILAIIGNFI